MVIWARQAVGAAPAGSRVMTLGDHKDFHQSLDHALERGRVPYISRRADDVFPEGDIDLDGVILLLCGYRDARSTTHLVQQLSANPKLKEVPFEYVAGLDRERDSFARSDEYQDTYFVSPSLLDDPSPYKLYERSLELFEQKCGLRDYLDLYQCIKHVVTEDVPGDIAEFGSYRGHSGWLIAQTLSALGSTKRLHMFDTFDQFPTEPIGVDHVWSHHHRVDFSEVSEKFALVPNATLVRGEFTQTLADHCPQRLALTYVDCDSYRATKWLLEQLLPARLSQRGVLVCEDYGHPGLAGNRAAIHEVLDRLPGYFRFFSEFSGLYLVVRQ